MSEIIVLSDSDENNENCEKNLDSPNDFLFTDQQRKIFDAGNSNESEDNRKKKKKVSSKKDKIPDKDYVSPVKKARKRTIEQEERAAKKKKLAREKALRTISSKRVKNLQPGACLQFIDVILDHNLRTHPSYTSITDSLIEFKINHQVQSNEIRNSIIWQRRTEEYDLDENNCIQTTVKKKFDNQMIVICDNDEILEKVKSNQLISFISNIKKSAPRYQLNLVLFDPIDGAKNKQKPKLLKTLNLMLVKCQILFKCGHRSINDSTDLGRMIYQYTKSIAEKSYKLDKNKPLENFDWYVFGDKKNTVAIDEHKNGCKRLWKQQLCQFNMVGLEMADSICSLYSSPSQLYEAYANTTVEKGESLLKDVPVRRVAGPLSSSRKIGPSLSKKMYLAFTSEKGNTQLSG